MKILKQVKNGGYSKILKYVENDRIVRDNDKNFKEDLENLCCINQVV